MKKRGGGEGLNGDKDNKQVTLRINPDVAKALRTSERDVMIEIEDYLGPIDITSDPTIHRSNSTSRLLKPQQAQKLFVLSGVYVFVENVALWGMKPASRIRN